MERSVSKLFEPTGPYLVGHERLRIDNSDVLVVHPVLGPGQKRASWFGASQREQLSSSYLSGLSPEQIGGLTAPAYHGVAAKTPLANLVFLHGARGLPEAHWSLLSELASYGYRVFSVTHPAITLGGAESLAAPPEDRQAHHDTLANRWTAHTSKILEGIVKRGEPACEGAIGFSLGGGVARALASKSDCTKFAVNIGGSYYGETPDLSLAKPFLEISHDRD
ncbi:MAG: dienelactone hydrolase family protein [Myxococcales bacterium]|nr:dienelactone hydrolase family protein [Myxococcales bacterium]